MKLALLILAAAAAAAQTQVAGVQIAAADTVTRLALTQAHQLCKSGQVKVESVNRTAFSMDGAPWIDTGHAILTPAARCFATSSTLMVRHSIYSGGPLRFDYPDMTDPAPDGQTAIVAVFLNIPPAAAGQSYTYRSIPPNEYTAVPGSVTLHPREPIPAGAQVVIEYRATR